jgi:hypothetical protein
VTFAAGEPIFNIDECGFSEWEDRKKKSVLIPQSAQNDTPHDPVGGEIRHQTPICYITTTGTTHCPLLISGNPHVTQVFNTGVWDGIKLKITPSPYARQAISEKYLTKSSFPLSPQSVILTDAQTSDSVSQ